MGNIGLYLVMIIGGLSGGLATIYIVLSLPITIIYKIYRKVTKNISLMK